MQSLTLYSYWRSSCAWRVRIALNLKNIPHQLKIVNLLNAGGQQHQADYVACNTMAQVPTLEWCAGATVHHLTQSLAIIRLLDRQFPNPPLWPADPLLAARVDECAEIINSGIQPVQNLAVTQRVAKEFGGDAATWNAPWIAKGLTALECMLKKTAGTYAIGETVSVADCCLIPQLYSARRFTVDVAPFPTLLRIEAACAALPAFQAAHADVQLDAVR